MGKTVNMLTPENYIRKKARSLPVYKCFVNNDWRDSDIANVWVSRQHINGNITAGFFLVDLLCLGVKNSFFLFNVPDFEFHERLQRFRDNFEVDEIDYTLAHNIIYAGLEFAEEYGFKPHKDFAVSKYLLDEDTEDIELIEIECGTDGKPTIIKGPHNIAEADRTVAILEKTAGPGNYLFFEVSEDNFQETDDFEDDELTDKEIRFIELISDRDKLSDEEEKELVSLSCDLFDQYLDDDIYDVIYDEFESIFDLEIDDTFYDGVIGIPNLTEKDANKLFRSISEIVHVAYVKSKPDKARKKLNRLIKTYGSIPILEKMDLFLLYEEGKDPELLHHQQALDKYPDFAMLKFQLFNRILQDFGSSDDFDHLFEDIDFLDFFKNRQKIHSSELLEFLLFRFKVAKQSHDLETIEVIFNVVVRLAENNDKKWMVPASIFLDYKMTVLSNDLIDEEIK